MAAQMAQEIIGIVYCTGTVTGRNLVIMSLKLMSIEQTDIVDIISIDGDTDSVVLTVNDPLDWSNRTAHEVLLQRKLHFYLSFVETGKLVLVYPTARGRPVVARVVFRFPPNKFAMQFLETLKVMLEPAGLVLKYESTFL
jgi:hypothetical protein